MFRAHEQQNPAGGPGFTKNITDEINKTSLPDKTPSVKRNPTHDGLTAFELVTTVFPEQRWAVLGLIPEGMTLFSGAPKMGKSWLALGVAFAVGSGGLALGTIPVEAGEVLYLALEDSPRRLQNRLKALLSSEDIPAKSLERIRFETDWPRMGAGGLKALEEYALAHSDLRLVVVDTFAKFRPLARPRNSSFYEVDYQHAGALKAFADEHRLAVLVVHHLRKASAEDIHATLSGSQGLPAAADGSIVLERARGVNQAKLHLTGRDVEEQVLSITWDAQALRWTLNGTIEDHDLNPERLEIMQVLRESDSPLSPQEIADATGKARPTVSYLLGKLTEQGLASKAAYGRYEASQKGTMSEQALSPGKQSVYVPPHSPYTTNSYLQKESVSSVSSVSGIQKRRYKPTKEEVDRTISLAAKLSIQYSESFNRSELHRKLASEGIEVSSLTNFSGWLNHRKELIAQEVARLLDGQEVNNG